MYVFILSIQYCYATDGSSTKIDIISTNAKGLCGNVPVLAVQVPISNNKSVSFSFHTFDFKTRAQEEL